MMRRIYIFIFLFSFMSFVDAQQTAIYSHEFYKTMISNPAFTGSSETTNAMLISRSQWIDFKNAPQQNLFTLDGIMPNKKMGIGIDLFTNKKGISNKTGGDIYYSYHLMINENTRLSFGIALGVEDHTLHYSEAVIEDPSDPFLFGSTQRETSINGNAGLGFSWKKLEAGISVPQLLGNAVELQDNTSGKAYYALSRHYLGLLKYRIMLSEDKQISLSPMGLLHFHPNAPVQYDANLNLEWKDKLWIGATYKSDYAIAANAGFCIGKQFYIGYSYDFIIGNIGKYSGMSHELMLNFVFGKAKHKEMEPVVPVMTAADKEKTDSLQAELEIKENTLQKEKERAKELNAENVKLKAENESLKKQGAENNSGQSPAKQDQEMKTPDPAQSNSNQNSAAVAGSADKTMEHGVWIMSAKKSEFNYLNNKPAPKGYYVITGTFFYRDFAGSELKKIRSEGYSSADILFSPSKQFNYVFLSHYADKEEAIKQTEKIKTEGVKDAWVLFITE